MLRSTGIDMYRLFWNVLECFGFAWICFDMVDNV